MAAAAAAVPAVPSALLKPATEDLGGTRLAVSPTLAPGGGGGGGGGYGNISTYGGNGGFGGGAGGAGETTYTGNFVGNSIFGGGGGGGYSNALSGQGGFGGGSGTSGGGTASGGGGGAALGGAIFVGAGSTLTITGAFAGFSGSTIHGGTGGGAGAGNGKALGADIFLLSTGTINFQHTNTVTILTQIDSDKGAWVASTPTSGLVMSGTGTLVLANTNSYTGSTTMQAGVVSVSRDNNLGVSSAGLIFQGGTLEMTKPVVSSRSVTMGGMGTLQADTGTSALLGVISGTGPIQITGAGKMQFVNTNTYTGTTNILNGGTLQIFVPANISPATINLNNGTLELLPLFGGSTLPNSIAVTASGGTLKSDVAANGIVTLGGAISTAGTFALGVVNDSTLKVPVNITGAGGMTKLGIGKMVLSGGANTYSGPTTVSKGTLVVDGTITASPMTVASGAKLMGTGTTAAVSLSGIVAPGHSIGTLHAGNFTFNPGSRYDLEISDTTSDLIASSATVSIDGGTVKLLNGGFTYPAVASYTLITGTTVTKNTPFTLVNPFTRYHFGLFYLPTSVVLSQAAPPTPFHIIIPSGNAGAAATCFDTLLSLKLPDLAEVIQILDLETPAQMAHSFNQMQPANLNNVAFAEENVAERIRQIYTNHFFEQRVVGCPEREAWRLWVAPFVERARQHGKGQLPGYLEQFAGVSGAIDYHSLKHWMFTGGFSYASTEMHVPHGRTQANFKTYAGTLGTAWTDAKWFADAQFSYLYSPIDEKRRMHFSISNDTLVSTVNRTASHDDDSKQMLGHIGGGYDFKMKAFSSSTFNIYPFCKRRLPLHSAGQLLGAWRKEPRSEGKPQEVRPAEAGGWDRPWVFRLFQKHRDAV